MSHPEHDPMDEEFLNVAKLDSSSGSSDEGTWIPTDGDISNASAATLLDWLEDEDGNYGSLNWPDPVTTKIQARREVLREGLISKVGEIYSIRLANGLTELWTALAVCPEMVEATEDHAQALEDAHPDRPVNDSDMAFLWSACDISKLPITGNGEQDCEYRAHAICELINREDAVIGARHLAKLWVVSNSPNLGPRRNWSHHVAPVVYTTAGEGRIFDPLLCPSGPCQVSTWLSAIINSAGAAKIAEAWERLGKPSPGSPLSKVSDWAIMIGNLERSMIDQAKETD
jgi:Glutaminase